MGIKKGQKVIKHCIDGLSCQKGGAKNAIFFSFFSIFAFHSNIQAEMNVSTKIENDSNSF
jgi:hypothetical protein